MLSKINLHFLGINALFFFFLYREFDSLPPLNTTVSIMYGRTIGLLHSLLVLTFLLVIIPICAISLTLTHFKKYIFSHFKSVTMSYRFAIQSYLISIQFGILISLIDLLMYISSNKWVYLSVRISKLLPLSFISNSLLFSDINCMLLSTIFFIGLFTMTELLIAYKYYNSQYGLGHFCARNKYFLCMMAAIVSFMMAVYITFEVHFSIYSPKRHSNFILPPMRAFYCLFLNALICYFYFAVSVG